jgi:hypothetical protein
MEITSSQRGRSIEYAALAQEIGTTGRDETAAGCTHILWELWESAGRLGSNREDAHVLRAHLPRVFSIAAASSGQSRVRPTERQLLQWSHDLVTAGGTGFDSAYLLQQVIPEWRRALASSEYFRNLQVSDTDLVDLDLSFWVARVLRSQWEARIGIDIGSLLRMCALLRRVNEKRKGFFHSIQKYLQNDPIDFARAVHVLFALCANSMPRGTVMLPVPIDDEVARRFRADNSLTP